MNRTILVHSGWALLAIAAFAIGSTRSKDAGDGGAGSDSRLILRDGSSGDRLSAMPGGTGSKTGTRAELATTDRLPVAQAELSEADIRTLGEQLKATDPLARRSAFLRMLEGLTPENALEMREQVKQLNSDSSEWRDFHYAWGAIAGGSAVENGMESPERDMAVTLAGWASNDPTTAKLWFDSLPEDTRNGNQELKYGMISGLVDRDASAASEFVFQLAAAGDDGADRMLGYVASKVVRSGGVQEAANWSENLPEGPLRASAMDRVANDFVASDPQAAAAWAERFVNEPHSARVIEEVGDEWAERDPRAAVGWLESLESGEGQAQGLSSAFGEWVRRDPRAASEHLVSMPQSPARDSAISGFASRLAGEDPQSAIAWAGQIADAGARERTLVRAGQEYFRRNSEEARDWLATSGLPQSAQEQVMNPPQRRRR